MTRREFLRMARPLLKQHGLDDWMVRTDTVTSTTGYCWYPKKAIRLNRQFVARHDEEEIRAVLLHEIAHALLPEEDHSERWADIACEIGGHHRTYFINERAGPEPKFIIAGSYHDYFAYLQNVHLPRTNGKYIFISDPMRLYGRNKERVLCVGEYYRSPVWQFYADTEIAIQFINESYMPL